MNTYVFDLECDGLKPTKIHCLSYGSDDVRTCTTYDSMRELIGKADILVGHNIQRFDIPVLEKLLGIDVKARLIDTLAISWYLDPERLRHGLEGYGEEFGVKKPYIEDWENLDIKDYVHRCERDVQINTILWNKQWKTLVELYESEEAALKFLSYLEFKLDCAREQEKLGWKLDVDLCSSSLDKLILLSDQKIEELKKAMPRVAVNATKKKPAKPFKMNGELSKAGLDWKLFCDNRGLNPETTTEVNYVKDWQEPNPSSHVQIKDWLYGLGWKPETFLYKRDKVTNEIKKIPQVSQEKTRGPGLCRSVLKLVDKEPAIESFNGLSILEHRIGILKGFLKNQENGYLKAEVDGLTNTLRFKHRTIVNLPGVQTPYGEIIRGCLTCEKDMVLCGSDMSGLEDRLKQHYMYPYDPEYVKEMTYDGYDPHLDLAVSAGAVTKDEAEQFIAGGKHDARIKTIRHTYKQGNYACQYGARPARIALTVGCSKEDGQKIYDAYWKRNWAINAAAENAHVKVVNGSMWLYNPISHFWYSLRCEKDKFSTLVQGSAVYCFDSWLKYVRSGGLGVIGQFHDEWIAPIDPRSKGYVKELVEDCIRKVNNKLKLNRALDADVQFGERYNDIH